MILLVYKEVAFFTNQLDPVLPSPIVSLLHDYEDVFLEDKLHKLPPIQTDHQIDFVPRTTIPNQPAYRSNPEETKELQRQVKELMEKGYVSVQFRCC